MTIAFISDRQPLRSPPKPLVDPRNKLILFWMHRCGSTTGHLWFFEIAGWKDRMRGKRASDLARMWYDEHHEVYRNLHEYYRDPSFLKIAIVRHPLVRAVSSFTVVTDTISGAQWRAVAKSLQSPDDERRLSFLEFLDFLEAIDLASANYHWRLQTAQDWYDVPIPDIQIVRLESIQEDLDQVCRQLGKQPLALRNNSAQSVSRTRIPASEIVNFTRADFARIFGRDLRGVIRFPEYSNFFTPDITRRLLRVYERDFVRLEYQPQLPPEKSKTSMLYWLRSRKWAVSVR
jgi:hypothetical protein